MEEAQWCGSGSCGRHPFWSVFGHFHQIQTPVESERKPGVANFTNQSKVSLNFWASSWKKRRLNTEIWLCRWVPLFGACQLHELWSDGRTPHFCLWTINSVWEKLPTHAWYVSSYRLGKYELVVSEPPKMVTFPKNLGHPCNIDNPKWIQFASCETPQFTPITYSSHPWVLRTKKEAWEGTNVGHPPLRISRCREPASLTNDLKSKKSASIDDHDCPSGLFTPCVSFFDVPRPSWTRRRCSDVEMLTMLYVIQRGNVAIFVISGAL